MPKYNLSSGLPDLPVALKDTEYKLLAPVYIALNNLSKKVATLTGQVDYDSLELSNQSQIIGLLPQNLFKVYAKALGPLPFGALVHLTLDGGKISAELASSATSAKPAAGIVNVDTGLVTGQFGEIIMSFGYCAGVSGTSIGTTYYLSTGGLITNVRPSTSGNIVQAVGLGLGSLGLYLSVSSYFDIVP